MGGGSWSSVSVLPLKEPAKSHLSFEPNVQGEEHILHGSKKAEEIEEAVQIITGQFSLAWQSLKHVSFTASLYSLKRNMHKCVIRSSMSHIESNKFYP